MLLSIVIPVKNEEVFLPKLLRSIQKQNFSDYEVIVADAGSTDQTKEIAKSYGARIVKGGLPARGRNAGAEAARGDLLLFLDADVILPQGFFEKALNEIRQRNLDIASFMLFPKTQSTGAKVLFELGYNIPVPKLESILPFGAMGIMIKKSIHKKINGYNEEMKLCEDHNYVRRAAKISKFGVVRDTHVVVSLRRFEQDGWARVLATYILSETYTDIIGPIKSDIFKYKFSHYSKHIKD